MSAAFCANWGSVLTHQLRRRCRWIPYRRRTRHTCASDTSPNIWATRLPVQLLCPSGGGSSSWARMRRSVSSPYTGGFPDRGLSASPANRALANRVRHLLTVAGRRPHREAISLVGFPAAASSTMRARWAMRCSVVPCRVHAVNWARSSSVRVIGLATPAMAGAYIMALSSASTY